MDDFPLTPDITAMILARTISRAESDIDAYMGFDMRLGGFEPHTGWKQAMWDARTLRFRIPNFPVPMRRSLRYQIQVSNLSGSGAGFMAIINNTDVAFNTFDNYVEIVPLQSITYSLAPVLVQLGLRPPIVQMDYEAGFYLPVLGEILIDTGDHKTYDAQRGFWSTTYTQALSIQPIALPPVPPNVYKNGTLQVAGYTLNATDGQVVFSTANAATDVITLDYTYQIPDNIRDATILQTTYLLGQRALNRMGMQAVESLRSGDQMIKRHTGADLAKDSSLCLDAAHKLDAYVQIAVA